MPRPAPAAQASEPIASPSHPVAGSESSIPPASPHNLPPIASTHPLSRESSPPLQAPIPKIAATAQNLPQKVFAPTSAASRSSTPEIHTHSAQTAAGTPFSTVGASHHPPEKPMQAATHWHDPDTKSSPPDRASPPKTNESAPATKPKTALNHPARACTPRPKTTSVSDSPASYTRQLPHRVASPARQAHPPAHIGLKIAAPSTGIPTTIPPDSWNFF